MNSSPPSPAARGLAFLRLLQLASPALPIGAFAYSQGLEPAVAARLVRDEETAASWIAQILSGPFAHQDLPIFARLHAAHAAGDHRAQRRWNDFLFATRPTAELQAEDRQLGASLARVLATLGVPVHTGDGTDDDDGSNDVARNGNGNGNTDRTPSPAPPAAPTFTLAAQFARATAHFGVDVRQAMETFAFTWAEAQASAAVRLVPLGQSAGVRILARAAEAIPAAVERALALGDDDIAGAAPGLALFSAAHETQYCRLFRS